MRAAKPRFCRPEAFAAFRDELPRIAETGALVRAAAAIALHEHPGADPAAVLAEIRALGAEVRRRAPGGSPRSTLAHLHQLFFEELGFRGDEQDYYDPANSYLHLVLANRRGLPITLTLVYKAVAEEAGLAVLGINAPAHFLAGVIEPDGTRMLVDPFVGGKVLSREEAFRRLEAMVRAPLPRTDDLLAPATPREWLLRILANLKSVFARRDRHRDVRAMIELQAAL